MGYPIAVIGFAAAGTAWGDVRTDPAIRGHVMGTVTGRKKVARVARTEVATPAIQSTPVKPSIVGVQVAVRQIPAQQVGFGLYEHKGFFFILSISCLWPEGKAYSDNSSREAHLFCRASCSFGCGLPFTVQKNEWSVTR